jgi:hypothetical protein
MQAIAEEFGLSLTIPFPIRTLVQRQGQAAAE